VVQHQRRQRELPVQFAKSLIECEIAVTRPDATSDQLQKLMNLYTVNLTSFDGVLGGDRAL
jgi:hypothetical protein